MYLFVSNNIDVKKTMTMTISTGIVNTYNSLFIYTKKEENGR